jgi:hypothetical protein
LIIKSVSDEPEEVDYISIWKCGIKKWEYGEW